MSAKIVKILEVENLAVSGRVGNPDPADGQSFYFNRIIFAPVAKGSSPRAEADTYRNRTKRQPQSRVRFAFLGRKTNGRRHGDGEQRKCECFQMIHLCLLWLLTVVRIKEIFRCPFYRTKVLESNFKPKLVTVTSQKVSSQNGCLR